LYLSGESYAGIYIPYLAWQIYQANEKYTAHNVDVIPPVGTQYKLKGFMVGNGATNWKYDNAPSVPQTLWGFNMITTEQYAAYERFNCTQYFGGGTANGEIFVENPSDECKQINKEINDLGDNYFVYDYYRENANVKATGDKKSKGLTAGQYTPWMKNGNKDQIITGDFLEEWLNWKNVTAALNIDQPAPAWTMCSGPSYEGYHLQQEGSHWIYPILKYNNIRMAFYSGDTDGAIPTFGSKRWIEALGWPIAPGGGWRHWLTNNQVSGYITNYLGLDFVTVRGVGHMAPQWAPKAMQNFVSKFLSNQPLAELMPTEDEKVFIQ